MIPILSRSRFSRSISSRLLLSACMLAAAAGTQAADDTCQYIQVAKLPLRYVGPGLEIAVDGIINGKPATMLVDTGAFASMLTRTGAASHSLDMKDSNARVRGVGGVSDMYQVYLNEFTIGPAKSTKGWGQVIADTGDTPAYDAIAGAPFLLQMDLELSLADKELKFFQAQGCDKAFLGYWDRNAVVVPFEHRYYGESVNPVFAIEIDGHPLRAMIDTGFVTSALNDRVAAEIGLAPAPSDPTQSSYSVGIGSKQVRTWTAHTRSIKIGAETILDADINVMSALRYEKYDVVLGADFLRAHRVLFAMSQKKLYLSYVGGDAFAQRTKVEPWMRKEAENGNPDAEMALGMRYLHGNGVPRDEAQGQAWIDKALAHGHVQGNLDLAYRLLKERRYADAAPHLAVALAQMPDGRYEALDLYSARVGGGQQVLGAQELAQRFGNYQKQAWPGPIAELYLGRIDLAAARRQAAAEPKFAHARDCEITEFMATLSRARGDTAQADALNADWLKSCNAK